VKRLALLVLLLVSSCVVAAPAPLPKPSRKPEPPPKKQIVSEVQYDRQQAAIVQRVQVMQVLVLRAQAAARQTVQPPNADPLR
jgi:hypothetical protein